MRYSINSNPFVEIFRISLYMMRTRERINQLEHSDEISIHFIVKRCPNKFKPQIVLLRPPVTGITPLIFFSLIFSESYSKICAKENSGEITDDDGTIGNDQLNYDRFRCYCRLSI
jgi:hypothetical protein